MRSAADATGGVLTLAHLRELGVSYDETRAEVEAARWHRVGRRTISVVGPLPTSDEALGWRAVWDVGGDACLDGISSLLAWGLKRWTTDRVHVSVPRTARYHRVDGVAVHVLRRRGRVVVASGVPRTPPEVAALRAAMWARSDREAATVLTIGVQQRIVHPARMLTAWGAIARCRRHALLSRLVPLVADGAQALSEIDFAELGRARGVARAGPPGGGEDSSGTW